MEFMEWMKNARNEWNGLSGCGILISLHELYFILAPQVKDLNKKWNEGEWAPPTYNPIASAPFQPIPLRFIYKFTEQTAWMERAFIQ